MNTARFAIIAALAALATASPSAAQEQGRDRQIVRCIALLELVHEMRINNPLIEYRAHSILLGGLGDQGALNRLPREREWLLDNPESWTSGQDPFGCYALIERLAEEQSQPVR